MTPSIDQTLHLFANLLPNWTLIPILTLLPNFGGFHRTLQRVRLANRGRLLLRTPGPVLFGTCICSNVETILSWTCHVYGPFEFRTSLGTSILLLTKLLTHTKQCVQKYCETAYSWSGVNQMWILKNSKELLEHLKSPNFIHITSIISFDFLTLYTTIPHDKLTSRLAGIIRNYFMFKNGNLRYKYLVLGHEDSYFVKEHCDSKHKFSEDDIIKMLEFLVDNIFVVLRERFSSR